MVFVCGRYEGVDERVNELLCDRELSIGDYVLSGGELAAAVILDAVVRLLPGALGNPDSARHESFGVADTGAEHAPGEVPPRRTARAGCSTTRTTRALRTFADTRFRRCWRVAIMRKSAAGDGARRSRKRCANRPDLLARADLTPDDRRLLKQLEADQMP